MCNNTFSLPSTARFQIIQTSGDILPCAYYRQIRGVESRSNVEPDHSQHFVEIPTYFSKTSLLKLHVQLVEM